MSDTPATPTGQAPAGLVLGIDLGTTNSLAAVMTADGPRVLRDAQGEALIPSVVTYLEGGGHVVGREARALTLELPARTVSSVKRLIGRAGDEVDDEARHLAYPVRQGERGLARIVIDDREISPEEVSALVLQKVRAVAEAALDQPIRGAVITVPAYFDDAQRQATKDAAALAGIECLRIVNEPTAAALGYGLGGRHEGTVMVYDLGGGTFDVTVLKIQNCVFQVLATAGDTHLGGDDFDRLLVERILDVLRQNDADADTLSPYVRQAVHRSAEQLKMRLSTEDSAALQLDLGDGRQTELVVTRAEFEAAIAPLVDKTLQSCRRAMADAGLEFSQLDDVVLVGGSTRVPMVRAALAELTDKQPHTEIDPDQAVAFGAAVQADVLSGGSKAVLLLDVIPLSLGIETMGGVVSKLILRNSTIPTAVTEEFSTQVDNQTGVDINIYQGEREKVEDCRKLGAFKLTGIPPAPAGLPRVAVTFMVDADGVLRVNATEQRSGAAASISVLPSFGLTRDEVRRMMHESIEHAGEDMAAREAAELRNKATAMVRGTRKALELSDLPPDQTYSVKRAVRATQKALDDGDDDALRQHVDTLSKLTAQIADDVVSSAVTKSLLGPETQ